MSKPPPPPPALLPPSPLSLTGTSRQTLTGWGHEAATCCVDPTACGVRWPRSRCCWCHCPGNWPEGDAAWHLWRSRSPRWPYGAAEKRARETWGAKSKVHTTSWKCGVFIFIRIPPPPVWDHGLINEGFDCPRCGKKMLRYNHVPVPVMEQNICMTDRRLGALRLYLLWLGFCLLVEGRTKRHKCQGRASAAALSNNPLCASWPIHKQPRAVWDWKRKERKKVRETIDGDGIIRQPFVCHST